MHYKKLLYIILLFLITSCKTSTINKKDVITYKKNIFSNKGFTLIYEDYYFNQKILSKKLDQRSLIIFQKNLKKNTIVKITNITNNKSLIAKVGKNSNYPSFNNSVITSRIANELELDIDEPYIMITSINDNSMFVAKKSKTYDEEKSVIDKAPVNDISINDLNKVESSSFTQKKKKKFSYNIKVADFYYKNTALIMIDRIKNETKIPYPKIKEISKNQFRVYLGPFSNINSLQNSYNDINILEFENIEIIKND